MIPTIYIGIDPGIKGGYCIGSAAPSGMFAPVVCGRIDTGHGSRPMPDMSSFLADLDVVWRMKTSRVVIGIEQPGSRPVESAKQGERVGTSYGYIWGVTETAFRLRLGDDDFHRRVSIRWVHPATWSSVVHGTKKKPKSLTAAWVEDHGWTGFAQVLRGKGVSDHVCDAIAIAYGMSEIYPPA